MVNIIQQSYTKIDKLIFTILLVAIFALLVYGTMQESPVVIDKEALKFDVSFPEEEERVIEDFFDNTCSELQKEFGKIGTPYERDLLITNVMILKNCNVNKPCISDAKFEFIMREFNRGIIGLEEFREFNNQYRDCGV